MTDFKVGDVIVTPEQTLVRIEEFVHHGVFIVMHPAGYRNSQSANYLSKCKLATKKERAQYKSTRLESLRAEIVDLQEDIDDIKREIEEEEKMA